MTAENGLPKAIEGIRAAVARVPTPNTSIEELLRRTAAAVQTAAASNDPNALKVLVADLSTHSDTLADAVMVSPDPILPVRDPADADGFAVGDKVRGEDVGGAGEITGNVVAISGGYLAVVAGKIPYVIDPTKATKVED